VSQNVGALKHDGLTEVN